MTADVHFSYRALRVMMSLLLPSTSCDDVLPHTEGAPHRLHVEVECTVPTAIHAEVSIPVSSTAQMVLPAAGISSPRLSASAGTITATEKLQVGLDHKGREVVVAAFGSGTHALSLVAAEPAVLISAHAVGAKVTAACPANFHVNHVRFASYGNPTVLARYSLCGCHGFCHPTIGSALPSMAALQCLHSARILSIAAELCMSLLEESAIWSHDVVVYAWFEALNACVPPIAGLCRWTDCGHSLTSATMDSATT